MTNRCNHRDRVDLTDRPPGEVGHKVLFESLVAVGHGSIGGLLEEASLSFNVDDCLFVLRGHLY